MGINKKDVRYTMHLGLPASTESFYQEAGRAGRDGKDAECIILRTKSVDLDNNLSQVFEPIISPNKLVKIVDSMADSDLKTQLWLITNSLESFDHQISLLKEVYDFVCSSDSEEVLINSKKFSNSIPFKVQYAIYRLYQLGVISDWTVEDFFNGIYIIHKNLNVSDEIIEKKLLHLFRSYSGKNEIKSLADIFRGDETFSQKVFSKNRPKIEILMVTLLYWSHRHFNYARRQSLKHIYDLCANFDEKNPIGFRLSLEDCFRIDNRTNWLNKFIDNGTDLTCDWGKLIFNSIEDDVEPNFNIAPEKPYLLALKGMINRLLESYESNTALDMISVIVKALLGEYYLADSSKRLVTQLKRRSDNLIERNNLIDFVLKYGLRISDELKEKIAKDILSVDSSRLMAKRIYDSWNSDNFEIVYLEKYLVDLTKIRQGLNYGY